MIYNLTTNSAGQVNLSAAKFTPNTYDVTVTFNGNDCYLNSTNSSTLTVTKDTTQITANAVTTTYNGNKY